MVRRTLACGFFLAAVLPAAAQEWTTRGAGEAFEAGSLVDGQMAGILMRCEPGGAVEIRLTHNGAVFDRAREHTIVLSVDGMATMLSARAVESTRPGDDDFVASGALSAIDAFLSALARGRSLEVSAPSGRYTLGLAGSSRAVAGLRERCG